MNEATLTEADFQQIVFAVESAIKETPPTRAQPADEVPKVRGFSLETEWVIRNIALPFLVAMLTGVAKDISKYIAEGTLSAMKSFLIGGALKENPDFETASREVERILKDMRFSKQARQQIIGQIREHAERISKKAKSDGKKARL